MDRSGAFYVKIDEAHFNFILSLFYVWGNDCLKDGTIHIYYCDCSDNLFNGIKMKAISTDFEVEALFNGIKDGADYYCKERRVDLKLDLRQFYKTIRKDGKCFVNKYLGLSLNTSYPRSLRIHRGAIPRHLYHKLYKDARIIPNYCHVNERQHTIKEHHDVDVTLESNHFFRICDDLFMDSDFIEIRCCRNEIRFASVDLFDRKYCEEYICMPQHLNVTIKWVNELTCKIVYGLFETKKLVHFKRFKKFSPKIRLLMKLVDKTDIQERQLKALQDMKTYEVQDEDDVYDENMLGFDCSTLESPEEGVGMELKLFFDFGPTKGPLLLGIFPYETPLWSSASGIFTHPSTRYTDSSTIFTQSYVQESHYISSSDSDCEKIVRFEGSDDDDSAENNDSFCTVEEDSACSTGHHSNDNINKDSDAKTSNTFEEHIDTRLLFNDYEIGYIRQSEYEGDGEVYSDCKGDLLSKTCEEKAESRMLFDAAVDAHDLNIKYRKYKAEFSEINKPGMKSSRNLWFDEMT